MSINNSNQKKKNLGKSTDQVVIPGKIIELIHVENLSIQMTDKKIRKSQHRFTKIKLCGASLTAIYGEMASLVNGGEQWIAIYLDFCRMSDMISLILVEADLTAGQISGWKMDGKVSSAEVKKVINISESNSQLVMSGFLRVFKNNLGDGADYTTINFATDTTLGQEIDNTGWKS